MMPLVSVVIPAFHARATLPGAVASALAGGVPQDRLEILIESDDGHDYADAAGLSPAIRIAVTGAVGSGVGPARNRALARARGEYVAFLDADDAFAPGYLAGLLPLARAEGAAAAPMRIEEDGHPILTLWADRPRLSLAGMAETGASVRLMVARAACPPFAAALSQDILHAAEVTERQGGSLPLSRAPYRLRLSDTGVTAAPDFNTRVHEAYLTHVAALEARGLPGAAALFRAKIALNADYASNGAGRSYYRFIAGRQTTNPPG